MEIYLQATFIASAEYKKGTGIIEIELSQKVRPFYVDLNAAIYKDSISCGNIT